MSNSKPLKNGHDAPKALSQSASAIRDRRYRERKKRGVVIIRDIEITADLSQALISCGWLNPVERNNREAILSAIGAILYRALSAGVTPNPAKATLEVDVEAIKDALPWLKPGEAVTPQSAAKALEIVSRCAAQVGFDGPEYASRAKQKWGIQ